MIWLNPADPAIRSAVVSGIYGKDPHSVHGNAVPPEGDIDVIREALAVASDILTPLTAYRIHPAGIAVEEFRATSRAHRLTPNYAPIRRVVSVERVARDCTPEAVTDDWCLAGDHVIFQSNGHGDFGSWYRIWCGQGTDVETIRVTYRFGSTITASARRAVLWLAHQFWLEAADCDDCGECELPERTTSVQREGIGYTMIDPQDYLTDGKTGVPKVDLWISSVNPRKGLRSTAVYSPDSPPPMNLSIKTVREAWS